ncbi:helix-turn-helix transcriptional regulator [Dactylosporangium sp. NPDC050588]|uniref:helix-turn-helix domain-containing protein n=1 Tax=Dactylosporangium sp. NPDC050588 TaxID=3157211 RepID=UPI0033F5049B
MSIDSDDLTPWQRRAFIDVQPSRKFTGRGGLVSDVPPRHDPATAGSFGQLITRRRHQLGLTQGDLADQLCARSGRPTFTRHEISRYERGLRIPTTPLLTAIADSLDLPMAVLRRTAAADRKRRHAGSRR